MAKDDSVPMDGIVNKVLPNAEFLVELKNGHLIKAHVSGKIRMNHIMILAGDRVRVEMSTYDLTRGRIVIRYKKDKEDRQ